MAAKANCVGCVRATTDTGPGSTGLWCQRYSTFKDGTVITYYVKLHKNRYTKYAEPEVDCPFKGKPRIKNRGG